MAGNLKVPENMMEQGYKYICHGSLSSSKTGAILKKGSDSYLVPVGVFATISPKAVITPIEVTAINEITKNGKLTNLEIRYRINGEINQILLKFYTPNEFLTIADKLGYGG